MAPKETTNNQQVDQQPNEGRRNFLKQSSFLTALAITPSTLLTAAPSKLDEKAAFYLEQVPLSLKVNTVSHELFADPRVSLLDLLREQLGLTGTKKGCNQGACGACTVLVDGERINSCLALAVQYSGKEITTIEGLAAAGSLNQLQQAFVENDGFQCGYCTSGQICSAQGMLLELEHGMASAVSPDLSAETFVCTDQEIRERMSGNICRCGAYVGIVDAIGSVINDQTKKPTT
jgi:xanthine dehydrogenase YagT iron-sulfur-binding subunit